MVSAPAAPASAGPAATLYEDAPYARLMYFPQVDHDRFWVYTSEHTDLPAVTEMWSILPNRVCYDHSERCRYGFGSDAENCIVHYMTAWKGDLIDRPLTPEKFFSTKVLGFVL